MCGTTNFLESLFFAWQSSSSPKIIHGWQILLWPDIARLAVSVFPMLSYANWLLAIATYLLYINESAVNLLLQLLARKWISKFPRLSSHPFKSSTTVNVFCYIPPLLKQFVCTYEHNNTRLHLSWLKVLRSAKICDASVVNLFWTNRLYVFYICFLGHKSFSLPKMIAICWAVFLASDEPATYCTRGSVPRPASNMLQRKWKVLPWQDGWGVSCTIFYPALIWASSNIAE